jgi:hypothetical protein
MIAKTEVESYREYGNWRSSGIQVTQLRGYIDTSQASQEIRTTLLRKTSLMESMLLVALVGWISKNELKGKDGIN